MPGAILVDGVPADSSCLDERAFQFGDGLFETIAVVDAQPCLWDAHVRRLELGCARLNLPLPDVELFRHEVAQICANRARGVIKLYWTAGCSERGYRRPNPLYARRLLRLSDWPEDHRDAWHIRLCAHRLGTQPALAGIKHLNRLDQVIARNEWLDAGVDEGLMLNADGQIISGTMSNLFLQCGETLVTPSLHDAGIAGVVRGLICELAEAAGSPVRIAEISLEEVRGADAIYLSNSLIGVKRVASFEDVNYDLSVGEQAVIGQARTACYKPAFTTETVA